MSTNPTAPIPVAILVRVSSKKQENDRQIQELQQVASTRNWNVIQVIEEKISGDKKERTGLDIALQLATTGQIKKVLVHEVSRVGRRNGVVHNFLDDLCDLGVSLYWHTQAIETMLPNGKRNPAASMMFAMLSDMARNERETIGERIKSGLDRRRREGGHVGRKKGTTIPAARKLELHKDIVKLLKDGYPIRKIAVLTEKAPNTVLMVKKLMAAS